MKLMVIGVVLFLSSFIANAEPLAQYAKTCDKYVGGTVNGFNCLDGTIIPIQGSDSGPCENPSHLNGKCHYNSRLGKLESGNPDVEVRFLCRHYNPANGESDGTFNDIAVIQRNMKTGATCFYQSPTSIDMDGTRVAAPSRGDMTIWQTPDVTASQSCDRCHDNGSGFIKTPFLKGVEGYDSIPTPPKEMRDYYFPGQAMANFKAYSVKATQAPTCSSCHGMGSGNGGTSNYIGLQSAGIQAIDNQTNGFTSWMPFDRNSAQAHADCANNHNGPGCEVRMYEQKTFDDIAMDDAPLRWIEIPTVDIKLRAGESMPRFVYIAAGSDSVSYNHGHPQDECSWDNPHQEGSAMVLAGTAPQDGVYSLSGKTLAGDNNVCNILLVARSGNQQIELNVRVTISKESGKNGPQSGGVYNIVSRKNGKCLDTSDHSADNGALFQQWVCTGEGHQKFRLQDAGNGMYNLVAVHSNRCVSSEAAKTENGVAMIQWDCNGGPDQKVTLTPSVDGSYTVRFSNSWKCLDVPGGSFNNGTKLQQWDCDAGNPNQDWFFRPN